MSDLPGFMPGDPATAIGRSPAPRPPTQGLVTGDRPDPALTVPLGPGQDTSYQQVVIAPPARLSTADIERLLTLQFREAKIYDDRLQIARADAFRLYNGEPMPDDEPGRSQIILTEVKDSINAVMPTMMRVFAGSEHPVEFHPRADGDDDEAQQAQDYVQHVVFVENDGWRAIHDAITDAFQLKAGWIKWWWDYTEEVKTEHYYALLEPQAAALLTEPGVTAIKVVRRTATPQERAGILASPESQIVQLRPDGPILVYDAQITRKSPRNRPRLMAVPPEQVLIDTDASGPQDPCLRFLGHWRIVTVSDLVALGFPRDLVESRITQLQQQTNRVTRRRDRLAAIVPRQQSGDVAMKRVRYLEAWMRFDNDGDGISELHRVHAIGDYGFLLLAHEPAAHVQMARICPFMVPHRAIGESFADRIGDLQRAMTRVFRNILDSMAESIHPRTVIEENFVNLDDALNTEMGAIIRERKPGAIRELAKPFIGPSAIPIIELLQAIKESRTGITRTSQGLTADALQSTTAMAVSAQIAASADRLELIVRTVAEGVRDLYEGILRLCCEHQDRARTVLLRGKWVPIDPRAWHSGFNITVTVGVGRGTLAERMQVLGAILAQQKEVLQTMGPNNPICTLGQVRNTIADMGAAAGISNMGRYFQPLPTNYQYKPPPQPPSPDQIVAQAEMQKAQNQAINDQQKHQMDRLTALLEDDRLRDEGQAKAVLEGLDLMGKYGMHVDLNALRNLLQRDPKGIALQMQQPAGASVPSGPPGAPTGGSPPGGGPTPQLSGAPGGPSGAPGGAPGAPGAPPLGLAQRLFLPPQLITALSQANRATPPFAPPMPQAPAPAAPRPAMPGFGV